MGKRGPRRRNARDNGNNSEARGNNNLPVAVQRQGSERDVSEMMRTFCIDYRSQATAAVNLDAVLNHPHPAPQKTGPVEVEELSEHTAADALLEQYDASLAEGSESEASSDAYGMESLREDEYDIVLDIPQHIGRGGKQSQQAQNPANARKNQARAVQREDARARVEARMQNGPVNVRQIHRDIKAFISAGAEGELPTEPCPPAVRCFIHEIARMYALNSRSRGSGVDRACVISADSKVSPRKTPINLRALDRAIEQGQRAANFAHADGLAAYSKKGPKRGAGKKIASGGSSTRPQAGEAVGAGAAPIGEDNIGNRLLQRLGWTPGSAIGADANAQVSTEPVTAIFRAKERTGLGH